MRRNKIASLKQKIICIPIIMMTLISFIIPNYVHAGIGEDVMETLQEVLIMIPDAIVKALEKFFLDNDEEIFIKPFKEPDLVPSFIKKTPLGGVVSWLNNTVFDVFTGSVAAFAELIRTR